MAELCKKIEKPLNDKRKKMPDWTKEDPRHMREAKVSRATAATTTTAATTAAATANT